MHNNQDFMIIDAHTHICTRKCQSVMGYDFLVSDLVHQLKKNHIKGAIVSLQIRFKDYLCPNECRLFCENKLGDNCSVQCPKRNVHALRIKYQNDRYILYCVNCGKPVCELNHFLRNENEELIEQCVNQDIPLYPLVLLNESDPKGHLAEETEYFETTQKSKFYGYKIHPHILRKPLSEFGSVPTELPVLIHVGNNELCNMDEAISFAKRQKSLVVFAHSGLFQKDKIKEALQLSNVYFDTAALSFMSKYLSIDRNNYNADIFNRCVDFVLNNIPEDRLIWGSDTAYSTLTDELSILQSDALKTIRQKEAVFFRNACKVYRLN